MSDTHGKGAPASAVRPVAGSDDAMKTSLLSADGNQGYSSSVSRRISASRLENRPSNLNEWEFPGWGRRSSHVVSEEEVKELSAASEHHVTKIGELAATAICGNDITSSCLYVAGLVTYRAGKLAPISLVLVSIALWLFRKIYGEVVTAIPLNGGAYNALLNTTSKSMASLAACLAILSYIATGVVSGSEACHYLSNVWEGLNVELATILLLVFFAVLCFMGLSESAVVATVIFLFHILTLTVLCGACIVHAIKEKGGHFSHNWHYHMWDIQLANSSIPSTVLSSVFFGLCFSMLGISGFETSSQFVEEQKEGVFLKTLRNMWALVAFFNPLIGLLALMVVPLEFLDPTVNPSAADHQKVLLATMGERAAGPWLRTLVSVDAFIVLSGAVLTSYVGVVGLMRRMAMDRCLPSSLLVENKWRGTNHVIIFGYCAVASSLFLMLNGNIEDLSGVYTVSFLGVMALFAVGCMLLKYKRPTLPRDVTASWATVITGFLIVLAGIVGNVAALKPEVLYNFILYFALVTAAVVVMFNRIFVLKLLGRMADWRLIRSCCGGRCKESVQQAIFDINDRPLVFFCKTNSLSVLNKAVLYVRRNEQSHRLIVVHCHEDGADEPSHDDFAKNVAVIDKIYVKMTIDFVTLQCPFGPAAIEFASREFNVPKNLIFITAFGDNFPHRLEKLGGVRVITHA